MLVLEQVDAHYGKSHVLHGVSIEVRAGEVVGLLGRNGVGKTTTLKAIMGMARRTAGRITFEGRDLQGVQAPEQLRRGESRSPGDVTRRVGGRRAKHEGDQQRH